MKKEFRNTLILAICAVVLSLTSVITLKQGKGELYPFFDYKLYSHPDGLSRKTSVWHLYVKNPKDTIYKRIGNINAKHFDDDDFYYAVRSILSDTITGRKYAVYKGRVLGDFIFPDDTAHKNKYEIVEERYDLDKYIKENYTSTDTTVLLKLQK